MLGRRQELTPEQRKQFQEQYNKQRAEALFKDVARLTPEQLDKSIQVRLKMKLADLERQGQWYVTRVYNKTETMDLDKYSRELPDDYFGDPADYYESLPSVSVSYNIIVEMRSLVTGNLSTHYAQHLCNHSDTIPPKMDIQPGWIFWEEETDRDGPFGSKLKMWKHINSI